MTPRENFTAWFVQPIEKLMPQRDAGFVIAMVAFPLLERYLRRKTSAEPKDSKFIVGLLTVIPELESTKAAETFWWAYRHGLLHNVTMSKESHGLTHDSPIIAFDAEKVWLNPVLFARRVLDTIQRDFETFEGGRPIPTVTTYASIGTGSSTVFSGTGLQISAGTNTHDD